MLLFNLYNPNNKLWMIRWQRAAAAIKNNYPFSVSGCDPAFRTGEAQTNEILCQ